MEGSFEEVVNGRGMLSVFRPDQPVREGTSCGLIREMGERSSPFPGF